jgi:hypothetical protein
MMSYHSLHKFGIHNIVIRFYIYVDIVINEFRVSYKTELCEYDE